MHSCYHRTLVVVFVLCKHLFHLEHLFATTSSSYILCFYWEWDAILFFIIPKHKVIPHIETSNRCALHIITVSSPISVTYPTRCVVVSLLYKIPCSVVQFMYLNTHFIAFLWDSLGFDWYLAHTNIVIYVWLTSY